VYKKIKRSVIVAATRLDPRKIDLMVEGLVV